LASLASYHGVDNSHLRFEELGTSRVSVKLEEDTTLDEEMSHTYEDMAYLAIGGEGPLTAVARFFSNGQTRMFPFDVTATGRVLDLNMHLDLIHTKIADLNISLESPDGKVVELMSDVVADGDKLTGTEFDDEAAESIASGTVPFSGKFQPTGTLRDFAGTEIAGTWTLIVTDDTLNRNMGALLDWSIQIELATEPEGNLNYDSHLDATDIDLLFANFGSSDATYDLNADGDVDQQDIDQLVQNVMDKRYGDVNIDQDVDKDDFNSVTMNYHPGVYDPLPRWGDGNFDGDEDVDFIDAMRVVLNYAANGYPPIGNLSTGDKLNLSMLSVNRNEIDLSNVILLELAKTRNDQPNTTVDDTTSEHQLQDLVRTSKSSTDRLPSVIQSSWLENVDRSFRRISLRRENLEQEKEQIHFQ